MPHHLLMPSEIAQSAEEALGWLHILVPGNKQFVALVDDNEDGRWRVTFKWGHRWMDDEQFVLFAQSMGWPGPQIDRTAILEAVDAGEILTTQGVRAYLHAMTLKHGSYAAVAQRLNICVKNLGRVVRGRRGVGWSVVGALGLEVVYRKRVNSND